MMLWNGSVGEGEGSALGDRRVCAQCRRLYQISCELETWMVPAMISSASKKVERLSQSVSDSRAARHSPEMKGNSKRRV